MYTMRVSKTKVARITDLGKAMKQWRHRQVPTTTVQEAAEKIGVSKSTWSELENGKRHPGADTLIALEALLGMDASKLLEMAGGPSRRSVDAADRARRWTLVEKRHPRASILVDLLPEMTDDQVDMLLNLAERSIQKAQ